MLNKKVFLPILISLSLLEFNLIAQENERYEIRSGTILIYRHPMPSLEKIVAGGFLGFGTFFSFLSLALLAESHGASAIFLLPSAVFCGIGATFLSDAYKNKKNINEPIMILDHVGIWYEPLGFIRWIDIEGCTMHKLVYPNGSLISEYAEFEKKDGSRIVVTLTPGGPYSLAISKYKFCNFVDVLMSQAKRKQKA